MKIAAIQMNADLCNVTANLKAAKKLATSAFSDGAEWVILPEFFTSAMAFNSKMHDAVKPFDGEPMQMLKVLDSMKQEDGEGYIIADIDTKKKAVPLETIPDSFWIPNLAFQFRLLWMYQNIHGRRYYKRKTKSYFTNS